MSWKAGIPNLHIPLIKVLSIINNTLTTTTITNPATTATPPALPTPPHDFQLPLYHHQTPRPRSPTRDSRPPRILATNQSLHPGETGPSSLTRMDLPFPKTGNAPKVLQFPTVHVIFNLRKSFGLLRIPEYADIKQ